MTWIAHLLGGGFILFWGLNAGHFYQKEKEIIEATALTQSALIKSIPAQQDIIYEGKEMFQIWALEYPNPTVSLLAGKALALENKMDSLVQMVKQNNNDSEKSIQEFRAITQVHDSLTVLYQSVIMDFKIDRFGPLLFSDQLQWHAGQPITLQLVLAYYEPITSAFTINRQPVQRAGYQKQFNAAGTYPLEVVAKNRWSKDSSVFTYFVKIK